MAFMTLPRTPAQRSLIDASEAYVLTSQFYDTNNTCYLDPVNVPDFYLYDISQSMFETTDSMQNNNTYLNYIKQQKPFVNQTVLPQDMVVPDYRNHIHFQVNMDSYATLVDVSNYAFDVKFNIECFTGNFPTDFKVYMYRDRAAYMYDVSNSLVTGSTIPPRIKNYFAMYQGRAGVSSLEIDLRVIGKGNYYFLLKADSTNYGTFTIRPYCILKSDYGIKYPITSDLSFRRMPYENVKSLASNPSANLYMTSLYEYDISSNYIVGYDASGVSNDYMDYLIRTNDGTGFDPYSYCSYSFKKLSTSQTTAGSNLWFYSNSSNIVTDLTANSTYLSASNSSTFKLASGKSSTFKIINPFVANDIANPEIFVMPVEQVDGRYINTDPTNSFSITNTFEGSYGYNEIYTPASGIVPVTGSPLYVCDNPFVATIDISYNPLPPYATTFTNSYSFGTDASGVTGFTIQCPYNRAIQVEQITLKFAYIDITTQRTVLQDPVLTNGTSYEIQHYNNQATQLRIYRTSQILNKTDAQIRALTPLMILNRKRIFKVGTFSLPPPGQAAAPRSRNPEWGTYYTYDISGTPDPLQPYPEYYKTNGSGVQNPAPVANTYACIPFTSSGLIGAYYGLCFTRTPYTYDATDKNLLVNYQYNNLLTKREVHPNGITSYQIQLLNSALPAVSLVSKITYSYNGVQYEPALDLTRFTPTNNVTDISGELADTQMFLYDDSKSRSIATISNDPRYGPTRISDATKTSTNDTLSWGLEKGTIYKAGDNDSGYNFCSYIYNIPIRKSNSNVITIRGYVPTSRFTSGLRIIGKNWSDFGTLTLSELIQEIDDLVAGPVAMTVDSVTNAISNEYVRFSNGNYYSRNYALGLLRFNNSFKVKQTFGLGLGSASYLGEVFDGTTAINAFKAALLQYTNLYNGILANQTIVNTTSTNAITSLQNYVINRYAGVLPPSFLKRSRLSDPIPFQIRFKSSLIPPYSTAFDEWGLGWNLGFGKTDTSFGTQQTAETFIRIVDDYIYLRMNPEIDMNTIDITEKEYLSKSQDSFGQNQRYFSKLLLNTFGNFSQTYVQAPKIFNPILGKLDKLHFQWVDRYGVILNNKDCEFNLTLQITESVDQLDESSTLITGVNQNQPILSPNQSNKK
jgi:hypothetical protein